jgi:hypothetical protein
MVKKRKQPTPARRSNVAACTHDPETGHMTVTFHDGRRYRYTDVPASLAQEMQDSASKGSFLNSRIIGKFDYTKISD